MKALLVGKIHIVGDFGTDKGNGTFQSIGFGACGL